MAGIEDTIGQLLGDPESMAKIMSVVQSLGVGPPPGSGNDAPPPPPPPDDRLMGVVQQLMQLSQQAEPKQQALLSALKPFVRPDRRERIDRALRIARISHIAGCAIQSFGKEGDHNV